VTDHRAAMHEVGLLKKELQEIRHTLVDKCPPLGYTLASESGNTKEVNVLLMRQATIINRLVELSIYK
tara:strand:+ start:547 stop:750 length:204 start_codon:yes stop_codon:yes gene_type:complete